MHSRTLACAAAMTALALAGAAHATIALDQSQLSFDTGVPFNFPGCCASNLPVGQSFTAGVDGYLADILIEANGDPTGLPTYNVEVLSGDGPDGAVLGSGKVKVTLDTFFARETLNVFSLGVQLTAGDQYTFYITGVNGGGDALTRGLVANDRNPYAGGRIYLSPHGYGNQPNWDLTFQTFVSDTPYSATPEPAAWALMLMGFGGLGAMLRRRRARSALA